MTARNAAIALALITTLGAALRWWGIAVQPLWADEALTAVIAEAPSLALATLPLDPSGPLYYWLHQAFVPDDPSRAAMRAISLVAGTATIPATYWAGRQLMARGPALLAAGLVALSFPLIDYAKEARCYALLTLLFVLAAAALMAAAGEARAARRRTLLAGFAGFALAALYTHPTAFPFVALALAIAVAERSRIARGEALATLLAVALLALPELWRIWRYASEANAFGWLRPFGPVEAAGLVGGQWLPLVALGGLALAAAALAVMVGGAFAARKTIAEARASRPLAISLLAVWLAHPFVLWLAGMLASPLLMARTALPAWPAFALAVALLLSRLPARRLAAASAAILALYALNLAVTGPARAKEDWDGAARTIAAAPIDAVLVCPSWKGPALLAALPPAKPGPARPVLVDPGKRWRLVGQDGPWPSSHARGLWLAQVKDWLGPPPPIAPARLRVTRIAMVTSECAVAGWPGLGGGRVDATFASGRDDHDNALGEAAPVAVRLVTLDRPLELTVWAPAR